MSILSVNKRASCSQKNDAQRLLNFETSKKSRNLVDKTNLSTHLHQEWMQGLKNLPL